MFRRLTFSAHARFDPTNTAPIRARYERDLVRRFQRIAKLIHNGIGKRDGLNVNEVGPPVFDFRRDPDKAAEFMDWLRNAIDEGVLEVKRGTSVAKAADKSWQNVYIRSAYQKGLAQAAGQMRKAGATVEPTFVEAGFYRPIHADRVGLAYTRAYTDLEGITSAMDAGISRALAQGLSEGVGAREIARTLVETVEGIGVVRARMLARTEVIRSHADATLNTFREAGVEDVEVLAEFSTAGDGSVCPRCKALEGKIYSIDKAQGIIPVHPNCRCAFLPVVDDLKGVVLR